MYREIYESGIEERCHAPAIRRLLAQWRLLVDEHGFAPFAPFDPISLGPDADDLIVMVPLDGEDYVYAHYGSAIVANVGMDMTGHQTSEFKGEVGDFFRDINARAVGEGIPILTLHRGAYAVNVHIWERLILPCRDADGSTIVVVYCKPRELRDDLLTTILDASLDGIVAMRLVRGTDGAAIDGQIIAANRRAGRLVGRPVEDMLSGSMRTVFPRLRDESAWDRYVRVVETREPVEFVADYPADDGSERWYEIAVAPLGDGVLATYADITTRKLAEDAARLIQLEHAAANEALKAEIARRQELEEELSRLATRDPLTGALNRRAITDGLQRGIALAERYGHPVSLFAVDLDHFKRINDRYGHAGGDAVLKAAVDLMTHGLREEVDLFGRLGGEEFVAVLPHTGLTAAAAVAERMRALAADQEVPFEDGAIRFSASFGVAAWDGRESLDRLLSRADTALYRAKASGRNVVCVDEGDGELLVVRLPGDTSIAPAEVPAFRPRTRQNSAPRRKSSLGQG
ncbi:MAG: diguanylate cyclase [Phreatobacter sp.]|uniref:sensor domain-containing diguanylate cyclase n=1 Tax=Phreatobacter sp. TaxID=1966341 RepID=UPI001A49B8B3|nr:sensor domain-containing diguanylate cyclase [Phreatobacter sp.]MBL8568577.1 diguanylate cyclase [Phreatobacter sp.]